MKLKKILAGILAAALVVTAVPTDFIVQADENITPKSGKINAQESDFVYLHQWQYNTSNPDDDVNSGEMSEAAKSEYQRVMGTSDAYHLYDAPSFLVDNVLPYVALNIRADETREYTLTVSMNARTSAIITTFGVVIDGVTSVYNAPKNANAASVNIPLILSRGDHTIIFTSVMPENQETALKVSSGNWWNYYCTNSRYYSFTLPEGLTALKAPTKAEAEASLSGGTRIEAENTQYVSYDLMGTSGYGAESKDFEDSSYASGGKVVGGVSTSSITQTYDGLKDYLDKKSTPYVQYRVNAPKDGKYTIRLGALINRKYPTDGMRLPYCAVLVNDDGLYKAQFSGKWGSAEAINLTVDLKAGVNIIRCTSFTYDQNDIYSNNGWACINHDYLELDSRLTAVSQQESTTLNATSAQVLGNKFGSTSNGVLGNGDQGTFRADRPSAENLAEKANHIKEWPFAAVKINADKAGYYDMSAQIAMKANQNASYIGVIVNGTAYGKGFTIPSNTNAFNMDASVYLEQGNNIVVFTQAMPKDNNTLTSVTDSNVSSYYPWFNFHSFTFNGIASTAITAPTLGEVRSSIGTKIDAGDTNEVLIDFYDNVTASKISERNYTYMVNDLATIETLPYSGNKIQSWPYTAIQVSVATEGDYEIGVNVGTKLSNKFGLIVDDKVYQLNYTTTNYARQNLSTNVHLTAGTHVLTLTSAIPENVGGVNKPDAMWDVYTATDVYYFLLDKGLTVTSKPSIDTITAFLGKTLEASDSSRVINNKFGKNANNMLSSPDRQYMKDNRVSCENLLDVGTENVPYAAFEVSVPTSGNYEIGATIQTDKATDSKVAMIIDETEKHNINVQKIDTKQVVKKTVHLEAGTHIVLLTSPMPATNQEAQAVPDGNTDNWVGMNTAYPWMDLHELYLSKGVSIGNIFAADTLGIEAENATYIDCVGEYKVENYPGASNGQVIRGNNTLNLETNVIEAESSYNWSKISYIQFAVDAADAGDQNVTLNVMAEYKGDTTDKSLPKAVIYVNGELYEVSLTKWNEFEKVAIPVKVSKGKNIIKCFGTLDATLYNSRFTFDYLEIDSNALIIQEVSSISENVKAGNVEKVLANAFNNVSDKLEGADTSKIRPKKPSVEMLHLTGQDLLEWPWAAMKVTAEKAGYYDITANIGPNTSATSQQIAVLVDGVATSQSFKKASSSRVDTTIYLEEGTHVIVFTSPMPITAAEASETTDSNISAKYPWINYNSFDIDKRLVVETKPSKEEIANDLGITVNAGDDEKVLPNNFKDNGDTLGGAKTDNYKNDRVSLETILSCDIAKATFAALEVTVAEDGDYEVYTTISVNPDTTSKQIGLIIDGKTVKSIDIDAKAGKQFVGTEVELTAGTHMLVFTSAMPATDDEAKAVPAGNTDGWKGMNNAYPWFDFVSFTFEKDIVVENISESDTTGIEAEDTVNLTYYGEYAVQVYPGASVGKVASGKNTINLSSEFSKDATVYDWGQLSYVQFALDAKEAGKQNITLNVIPTCKKGDEDNALPKVVLYANGKLYEVTLTKGWNQFEEISVPVELIKGNNVIKAFATYEKQIAGAKFAFDYIEFDKNTVSIVSTEEVVKTTTTINAGDETKVLPNYYADKGDTLGDANYGDLRYDKLTLDVITVDNLPYIPYAGMKVKAEADGYYDISAMINPNTNAVADHIGLIVDGTSVYTLGFAQTKNSEAKATVYLTKGAHTLLFTSPMLETAAEFEAYAKENKLTTGNGSTHPYMDFVSFVFSKGLTVEKVPTVAEVENPFYTRIEAENTKYALYNGYTGESETHKGASEDTVTGGVKRWLLEQKFEDLGLWIDASNSHTAYVEYAIVAPEDGKYDIRVGYVADVNKNVENRMEIAKPFAAVLVNDNIYKAQYTADWGESQAIKLNVDLKKGLNIIRCTTYTADQEIFTVSSWINQDFIDLDKRLTALERSTTVVEAEDSKFYNLLSPQKGEEKEKASNGKVLGSAKVIRAKSIGLTLENFTVDQIRMIPYFSYTVEAPMDGYYSLSLNFCGDGRLAKSQIGVLVDDDVNTVRYNRSGSSSDMNKAIITVYLTKGEHNLTFTSPMPLNAEDMAKTEWSHRWMNFDYVTFHDGLKLSETQKSPTNIADLVRIETENVGLPNLTKVVEAAEGKDVKEGYVGSAKYRRSQSAAEIKKNGIDARQTPFVQYTISASKAGTYTAYFSASYGIYKPTVDKLDATVAIEVNGQISFHTVHCEKNKTNSSLIPVEMKLNAGQNIVRLTHLTSDSIKGEGYAWLDYNYIEVPATTNDAITFLPTTGVVEAERADFENYASNASAGSSGGMALGSGDYKYIDEKDITFENLDVDKLGSMPRVTYTVEVAKAGTYDLSVQFNGGVINYTFNELVEKGCMGFAMAVNGGEKQLIEFAPDAGTGSISRIISVDLQQGENKIMFTTVLADYMSGVSPRIEDEYRLYWLDHDALRLSYGVSPLNGAGAAFDVNATDIDHDQLSPKTTDVIDDVVEGNGIDIGIIIGAVALLLFILLMFLLLKKKKESEEAEAKRTKNNK